MDINSLSELSADDLKHLVNNTQAFMDQYKVHLSSDSAVEFKRRLNLDMNSRLTRPLDAIDLGRYRVIADSQKDVQEPEGAIVVKMVVTREGIKIL